MTHVQEAKQANPVQNQAYHSKPLVRVQDPVAVQALDQDLVPEAVQDRVADLVLAAVRVQDPVADLVPEAVQALEESVEADPKKTHILTSFIPEMVQSNTAASSIATAALTPTITPMATTTTVIPQTITSTISMVQMDKAEENNPPLSPSLRKVSISKGYKQ